MTQHLSASQVALRVAEADFPHASTFELDPGEAGFGQDKAVAAVRRALRVRQPDHHLFAAGPPGTGKMALLESMAQEVASTREAPEDLVVAHDFDAPLSPLVLRVPSGRGAEIAKAVARAIEQLNRTLPAALNHRAHRSIRQGIVHEAIDRRREALVSVEEGAKALGFGIDDDGQIPHLVPFDADGGLMRAEEVERLDEARRRKLEDAERSLRDTITQFLERQQEIQEELEEVLEKADNKAAARVVKPVFQRLRRSFKGITGLVEWLKAAEANLLDNWSTFIPPGQDALLERLRMSSGPPPQEPFLLHPLVEHDPTAGAPVVVDWNPSFSGLVGRLERRFSQGVMETSHTLIRAGSLLEASGGFLLLPARELLTAPLAWPALKRALRERLGRIHDPEDWVGAVPVNTLHPEPVPLDVKVVLVGSLEEYLLLREIDDDFARFFKVRADFDVSIPRDESSILSFARWVGRTCAERGLRHLDASGVAALVERSSRLAGRQEELSLELQPLTDLLVEADQVAAEHERELVDRAAIEEALEGRRQRENLYHDRMLDDYRRRVVLVDVEGSRVGQVNGLALLEIGDIAHALPMRITARTYAGGNGLVNIERESDLSGSIHSKAVLILTGFLGGLLAQEKGLAMSASLTFEQSYSHIEGDSASIAELVAVLSSLADLPVRQDLAVTGSMSQHGEVQAIGGINEKIEGFFDVCVERGLTGSQGVVMPRSVVDELNVAPRVRRAIEEGRFHLYAIEHVEEAIALLLGHPAGKARRDGTWPKRSVYGRAAERLARMSDAEENRGGKDDRST